MGGLLSARQASLTLAALVFLGAGVLPVGVMLAASFLENGRFSLGHYREVLGAGRSWALFGNSVLLSLLTTISTLAAGIPLGVLLGKTDLPLRSTFAAVLSLPLVLPPYVMAVGWFDALLPTGFAAWLFGLPGCLLVLVSCYTPVVTLLTMTYLHTVNPSLEEAARLSGDWRQVLRKITLPLVTPGVALAALLVFLLTFGEFGATTFLRFDVFPVASFTQFSAFYNFGAATAAAAPLVAVTLLALALEGAYLRGRMYHFRWITAADAPRIPLGRARVPLAVLLGLVSVVLVAVPIGAIVRRGASVRALGEALDRAGDSALRSLAYASISATLLTGLGLLLGYLIQRRSLAGWRFLDASALFLFTLPGTVVGVGLIALWNRPLLAWAYTSPVIVVLAFLAQYTALSSRIVLAGLSQIPPSLEEAAELFGASWFRRLRRILVPALRRVLVLAWVVSCLFCLRDVSLPLLLAPPGRDTLTARTMTLMANGAPELIAALCLLWIGLTAVPLAVLVMIPALRHRSPV